MIAVVLSALNFSTMGSADHRELRNVSEMFYKIVLGTTLGFSLGLKTTIYSECLCAPEFIR